MFINIVQVQCMLSEPGKAEVKKKKNGLFDTVLGVLYLILISKHCSINHVVLNHRDFESLISMLQNNFKFISAIF